MNKFTNETNEIIIRNKVASIPQIIQKTDEWYQAKTSIISATEVATILNCNPFQTVNQLFYEKTTEEPKGPKGPKGPREEGIENVAVKWGTHYEPIAKQRLKERYPQIIDIIELGLAFHPSEIRVGASPDGLILLQTNEQIQLWLVEIKCPFRRQLTQKIPYHYWLQIQTQLFVWTNLLKQKDLVLRGCLYCDNRFDMEAQHTYYEQYVLYDENTFLSHILPEIKLFLTWISPEPQAKRARVTDNVKSLYLKYLDHTHIYSQKQYKNYVNNDLLLDWLDLYGDLEEKNTTSNNYAYSPQLDDKINKYLHIFKETVEVSQTLPKPVFVDKPHKKHNGLPYKQLSKTYEALKNKAPLICNGALYNPDNNMLGYFDIIIQNQYLKIVFPVAYEKIKMAELPFNSNDYTFIQIKECHLKLCTKNIYILNSSPNHKELKMEQAHLHQAIGYQTLVNFTGYSFIISSFASYNAKGVTYENLNVLQSLGLFEPQVHDRSYTQQLHEYHEFLTKLHTEGKNWTIDPPSRPELYPNMKNVSDYGWRTYKSLLAEKNKDLTLLWNIGPQERYKLFKQNITNWGQLEEDSLKWNPHYRQIIHNMITSYTGGGCLNIDQIKLTKSPIEFFLDFEFINHYTDTSDFPISKPVKYIYMIGCVHVNHQTGSMVYRNYLINRLNKEQESIMVNQWLKEMISDNEESLDLSIFHWGNAEKNQIEAYLPQVNLNVNLNDLNLHMTDLCEAFKLYEVSVPNCWSYNLKEISRSLYTLHQIQTTWASNMSGDDTIGSIMSAERECLNGKYTRLCDVPIMSDVIQYNYVDCKVLEEIVRCVRDAEHRQALHE